MPTYGDKQEPGITSDVDSAATVQTSGSAPSNLGMVGQADLANGSASANSVKKVTRASEARSYFGSETESLLTQGIIDALAEGAYPVYACATTETDETGEDLSGLSSTSGTLANGPVIENPDEVVFTINSTTMTTVVTYEDPSTKTPGTDEVYLNPVTQAFEIDSNATIGNASDDVDYTHYDYPSATDAMDIQKGETIDFLVSLNENQSVADDVQTKTGTMEGQYELAVGIVGPGDTTIDPANYTQSYDDSRMQVVFGTRFDDNTSLLAAYAGKRASLGLDRTPIGIHLSNSKRIASYQADDLDRSSRGDLINENVVPLADEASGARVADDPTTVADDNADEGNIDYGYTRLLMDYVITVTRENEQPFIGRLNNSGVRDTFAALVSEELEALQASGQVLDYVVNVYEVDATTAELEIKVETAKPLRFIDNKVTVGSTS